MSRLHGARVIRTLWTAPSTGSAVIHAHAVPLSVRSSAPFPRLRASRTRAIPFSRPLRSNSEVITLPSPTSSNSTLFTPSRSIPLRNLTRCSGKSRGFPFTASRVSKRLRPWHRPRSWGETVNWLSSINFPSRQTMPMPELDAARDGRQDQRGPRWNYRTCKPEKKEATRPIIPGKNPKTQRDVQSGRLVLRRREATTCFCSRQHDSRRKMPKYSSFRLPLICGCMRRPKPTTALRRQPKSGQLRKPPERYYRRA